MANSCSYIKHQFHWTLCSWQSILLAIQVWLKQSCQYRSPPPFLQSLLLPVLTLDKSFPTSLCWASPAAAEFCTLLGSCRIPKQWINSHLSSLTFCRCELGSWKHAAEMLLLQMAFKPWLQSWGMEAAKRCESSKETMEQIERKAHEPPVFTRDSSLRENIFHWFYISVNDIVGSTSTVLLRAYFWVLIWEMQGKCFFQYFQWKAQFHLPRQCAVQRSCVYLLESKCRP